MDLEGKRFAAARRHDGERGCTLRERLEHLALRLVQTAVADKRLNDGSLKRIGVLGGFPLPELPVLLALGLVRLDRLGAFLAVGANLRIARSVQIADEAHVFGIEARLEPRASAGGSNRGEHGFHRTPTPPLVYLHLERCVDYAVAVHEGFEVGAMEHDARNRMLAVGKLAGEVVLLGPHRTAARERNVAGEVARNRILLPEGGKPRELRHVFERKLR